MPPLNPSFVASVEKHDQVYPIEYPQYFYGGKVGKHTRRNKQSRRTRHARHNKHNKHNKHRNKRTRHRS